MRARGVIVAVSIAVMLAAPCFGVAVVPGAPHAERIADETGRVVVGFSAVGAHRLEAIVRSVGGSVVGRTDNGTVAVIAPTRGASVESVARKLEGRDGVRFAQPEQRVSASLIPNDPWFDAQWGLARIGAPAAWDSERGDPSVVVAVIDSGVDYGHPDLANRIDTIDSTDTIDGDGIAQDQHGHGTHVAGIVAGVANNGIGVAGLANGSTIMPIRVLDASGDGTEFDVAQGIRWAADHGASIINLSLGTPDYSVVLEEACDYAISRDCVVVASAGNGAGPFASALRELEFPAAYGPVVAVGAIDELGDRAGFSQWGPALDLMGPGSDIVSLFPVNRGSVATLSGTSMAAAHVSGAAALLRSQFTTWTASEVITRLETTAEDLGEEGPDEMYGFGLVRPDLALQMIHPVPVDDPTGGADDGDSSGAEGSAGGHAATAQDGSANREVSTGGSSSGGTLGEDESAAEEESGSAVVRASEVTTAPPATSVGATGARGSAGLDRTERMASHTLTGVVAALAVFLAVGLVYVRKRR